MSPGAPIKDNSSQPQILSKTEATHEEHKKFPWIKLLKATVFYIIIIAIDFLLVNFIIPSYSKFLPNIDPSIFQALIQVIATLLGFSIVAVFYYLGKLDDLKTNYINSLFDARKSLEGFHEHILSIHEKFLKSVQDVLDANNKQIPEQVKETISKMYAGLKNSNKAKLENSIIPIPEAIKTFEDTSNLVRYDVNLIVVSYGISIVLCFVALVTGSNKQIWHSYSWAFLIGVASGILSTSYLFNDIWRDFQTISNRLFRSSVMLNLVATLESPKMDQ
jgi:hypothetical protein